MGTLFETESEGFMEEKNHKDGHTCRDCIHRERWELSEFSFKIIQCCNVQRSKHSNTGYKTVKLANKACQLWKLKI
ncbi:hypothetical protein EZS27_011994 [termite gut metagenome]|uniref:Uncharacterized protein n=1 Tax=termite gut metagenome TaxID=433724 RepID=A0A5J4S336_9ZZZZ